MECAETKVRLLYFKCCSVGLVFFINKIVCRFYLTIIGVKIWHGHKWGCDNSISSHNNPIKVKMGLSHTSGSLYGVVTTAYEVITTPFIVMFTSDMFWV
jgi:hypothetical protein